MARNVVEPDVDQKGHAHAGRACTLDTYARGSVTEGAFEDDHDKKNAKTKRQTLHPKPQTQTRKDMLNPEP
eukprot:3940341-Rhodomonas_salina.2